MPPKKSGGKQQSKGGGGKKRQDDDEDLLRAFEETQKKQDQQSKASQQQQANQQALTLSERKAKHAEEKRKSGEQSSAAMVEQMQMLKRQQEMQNAMRQLQLQQMMQEAMSPILKEPKRDVTCEEFPQPKTAVGTIKASCAGEAQGWRRSMEDAHFVHADYHDDMALIGVFDGHSGDKCAKLCAMLLPLQLSQQIDAHSKANSGKAALGGADMPTFLNEALPAAFMALDEKLKAKDIPDGSGCTAVTVAVTKTHVICASVGDSRAVVGSANGGCVALSEDHKPLLPKEKARIEAAGGHVPAPPDQAQNRVNGELAMSRALGDFRYKRVAGKKPEEQLVIAVPDVMTHKRAEGDEFVAVACDGIFDVLENEHLVAIIRKCFAEGKTIKQTVEFVVDLCIAPGKDGRPQRMGTDNVSLIISML